MHLSLCLLTAQRSSQEKPAPCEGQQQRHWGPEPTDRRCFLMSQCRTLQISFGIGARAVVMAWNNSDSFAESRVNVWEMVLCKNLTPEKRPELEMSQRKDFKVAPSSLNNWIFTISQYWNFTPSKCFVFVVGIVFQPHNCSSYSCVQWRASNTICHLDYMSPLRSPQQGSPGTQLNHSLDGSQSNSIKPLKRI